MIFWYGTDLDPDLTPDPALFVSDLQDDNKKQFFFWFFCSLLFEVTLTLVHHSSFFKDKKP